jgi:hypothetical protein
MLPERFIDELLAKASPSTGHGPEIEVAFVIGIPPPVENRKYVPSEVL